MRPHAEVVLARPAGGIFDFARNKIPRREGDEFAGATFTRTSMERAPIRV